MSYPSNRIGRTLTLLGGALCAAHFFLPCYQVAWHERFREAGITVSRFVDRRDASPARILIQEPELAALWLPAGAVAAFLLLGIVFPRKIEHSEQLPQALSALAFVGAALVILFGSIFAIGGLVQGWARLDAEFAAVAGVMALFGVIGFLAWRTSRIPLQNSTYGRRYLLCHAIYILASSPLWEYVALSIVTHLSPNVRPWVTIGVAGWALMLLGTLVSLRGVPAVQVDSTAPWGP